MRLTPGFLVSLCLCVFVSSKTYAETGHDTWLRYVRVDKASAVPAVITTLGNDDLEQSGRDEIVRGIRGMLDRTLRVEQSIPSEPAIILGTLQEFTRIAPEFGIKATLDADGYLLKRARHILIVGADERGVLYGAFALLRKIALQESTAELDERQSPALAIRWVNEWNNLDATIERGYGGPSIFWENGRARADLSRAADYARMLASVGINGCALNNVNADPRFLTPELIGDVARVASAFRPWGVRVALAVDFGSPESIGGLETFDPLDASVAAWWKSKVDEIYRAVPDFAGFVLKADSEGRVGPSTYGRTHADAANVVARALRSHGGVIFYRGFVYDHHMDWQNPKNDRARAAYDNFHELDGKFDGNVIVQIKNGPIDFQVREPASPLFGGLEKTRKAIELQITQEYFGQARHTVFLAPMWKETLDFDMRVQNKSTPVKRLVNAVVGVSNVGMDANWFGNHMSQANLYAFGRLAWNADLTAKQIVEEWTRLTFGSDPLVLRTVTELQLSSWRTYENYTGPLGLQTLTDIVGNHYGVAVEASERNGWGQWHKADANGVGFDRTVASGTGFTGQYSPAVARVYDSLAMCPDDLVLFMHHLPYTYKLHSGKTVIQYIYDSHYDGAATAARYAREWRTLAGRVDEQRYREISAQLEYQSGQAIVWRDAVNNWFSKESRIPDARGRVGHHTDRIEAESMRLEGYSRVSVTPGEAASGAMAIECRTNNCEAIARYNGEAERRDIVVQYFDQKNGASHFRVLLGNRVLNEWLADDRLPTERIDSASSTRRVIRGIALRKGDEIRIEGVPDAGETAALDYIEIRP